MGISLMSQDSDPVQPRHGPRPVRAASGVTSKGILMATTEYTVTGMTCGHCETHVREEVEQIAGVTGIEVSAQSGKLVITSDAELSDADVLAAVDEAGYEAARL